MLLYDINAQSIIATNHSDLSKSDLQWNCGQVWKRLRAERKAVGLPIQGQVWIQK